MKDPSSVPNPLAARPANARGDMRKMFFAVAAVLVSLGYLLPTAIAYYREHRNATAITVLNRISLR